MCKIKRPHKAFSTSFDSVKRTISDFFNVKIKEILVESTKRLAEPRLNGPVLPEVQQFVMALNDIH